jgi:hypothetical protein
LLELDKMMAVHPRHSFGPTVATLRMLGKTGRGLLLSEARGRVLSKLLVRALTDLWQPQLQQRKRGVV